MTRHGAVDILLDPGDNAEVTRGLLARNCPERGLVVIHPAAESQSPAHDLLQALGVSVRSLHADRIHTQAAAWNAALAWARTARVTRIVLLRAHRLSPAVWPELCALTAQIGADVLLVFHQAWVPARWATAIGNHAARTFQSLDQVAAAYRWEAPRGPYRRPAPRTYPLLPAPLPIEPVLHWRAAVYRALPAADFARADTLYRHGFAAACAWIGEYRQLGSDVDERIQALLVRLVHDSPTPRHTLAQLRGAQAGFLAHGQHLAIPDLTGLGGPGLTSTALTDDLAARIRAGTGNPVLAAGLALALITGLDLPELLGFAVEDLSGSCQQVRIPLQYALSPHGERGYHLAAELLQPDSAGAVFHVPRPARPLIRAAYLCVLGAGRSIPHHRLLGGGGKPLAGWLRAAAERCEVALPDRTVALGHHDGPKSWVGRTAPAQPAARCTGRARIVPVTMRTDQQNAPMPRAAAICKPAGPVARSGRCRPLAGSASAAPRSAIRPEVCAGSVGSSSATSAVLLGLGTQLAGFDRRTPW